MCCYAFSGYKDFPRNFEVDHKLFAEGRSKFSLKDGTLTSLDPLLAIKKWDLKIIENGSSFITEVVVNLNAVRLRVNVAVSTTGGAPPPGPNYRAFLLQESKCLVQNV